MSLTHVWERGLISVAILSCNVGFHGWSSEYINVSCFCFSQVDQIKMMANATHQEYIIFYCHSFLLVYLHFNLEVYRLEVMTEKLDWNIGFSVEHTPICICCYQLFSLDLRYWKKKLHHGYPGHREAEITVVKWLGLVPFYFLSLCVKLMCTIHISSEEVVSCWVSLQFPGQPLGDVFRLMLLCTLSIVEHTPIWC